MTTLEELFQATVMHAAHRQLPRGPRSQMGPIYRLMVEYDLPKWKNRDVHLNFPFNQSGRAPVVLTYLTFAEPASMLEVLVDAILRGLMNTCRPETETLLKEFPPIRHGAELISFCGKVTEAQGRLGAFCIVANMHETIPQNCSLEEIFPPGHRFLFKDRAG
jgi:hypothetical protein